MNMKVVIKCNFRLKSCILYFILFFHFSILSYFIFPFLIRESHNIKTVNNMSARE